MRAGGSCAAVQQSLTAEAAGVVKQAVVLARRRGHAQVTPLHVANTMLAAPSGLFRVACLESHSHPLQCKALELCFNVALNRLPASSSSSNPMVGPHSPTPSISNALVAAFKRAQAHQRRGSVESQQPPLLAVKIELDQLVISILDDPSVSRVMREAGFSSTQVKSNVEKAVSNLELNITSSKSKDNNTLMIMADQIEEKTLEPNEDVKVVIEALTTNIRKRKSVVLVGESISDLEATIRVLMDRVDRGDVPEGLKEVKFISIPPLYSFCNLHREEVELKMRELTCLVKSLVRKGVVLYLGDLKWISDYRASLEHERSYYCSVEHMIMEIGRLVWGIGEIERFWLMGIATFQSYMRCRNGYHSLESLWGLHPLTIPANTLGFSLVSQSDEKGDDRHKQLSSCNECSAEAQNLQTSVCNSANNDPTLSSLPSWLKTESRRVKDCDQNCGAINEVWKKWNTFCMSAHRQPQSLQGTLTTFSSSSEKQNLDQSTPTHFQFLETTTSNPSSTLNSASSSDNIMDMEYTQRFKEFNAENLNILCNALEEKVPSQREIIPEIAGTILQCRSGMLRRRDNHHHHHHHHHHHNTKEETWLFFLGHDEAQAKEKISRELAKAVFGSYSSFVSIGLSSFVDSPTREDCRNKRGRDDDKSYMDRFSEAVSENPHRVFLLEDLDQADHCSRLGIKMAIERGRIISNENGEEIGLKDAIIVLSCESFRGSSPSPVTERSEEDIEEGGNSVLLDLNISFDDQSRHGDDLGILENVDRRLVFKSHFL